MANSHILSVGRFQNPSIPVSNNSNMSTVCVVFRNLDAAKTVFMAKSKLAKTGIIVWEYLTRKRKHFLDLARKKLGSKNALSIDGMIFVKQGPNIRKTRIAKDLIGEGSSA